MINSVADPDLDLRRGGGGECFSCPASFIPSLISSFFTQNKDGGGGGGGGGGGPRSNTDHHYQKQKQQQKLINVTNRPRYLPRRFFNLSFSFAFSS